MFFESNDKSYTMVNSYNYYGIYVNKILLFKKNDNEYIIRYNDVNKMIIASLQ